MNKYVCFIVIIGILVTTPLLAQVEPKQTLDVASAAYKVDGPEAFIKKLLEGGPMEENKEALAQSNMLRSIQSYFGQYESFELVQTVQVTATTRLTYVVFNYHNGPMFAMMTFFRNEAGWHVINFRFHTEPWQIWPANLLVNIK